MVQLSLERVGPKLGVVTRRQRFVDGNCGVGVGLREAFGFLGKHEELVRGPGSLDDAFLAQTLEERPGPQSVGRRQRGELKPSVARRSALFTEGCAQRSIGSTETVGVFRRRGVGKHFFGGRALIAGRETRGRRQESDRRRERSDGVIERSLIGIARIGTAARAQGVTPKQGVELGHAATEVALREVSIGSQPCVRVVLAATDVEQGESGRGRTRRF